MTDASAEQTSPANTVLAISFASFLILFAASQALFFATRPMYGEAAGSVTDWIARSTLTLEFSNEFLCFAMVALAIFLCFAFPRASRGGAILRPIVLAILAITIPVLTVMLVVQGRMVYVIGGLVPGESLHAMFLSVYLGCQHILFLAFTAIAIIAAFDKKIGLWARIVSPIASLALGAGAYSWLFPPQAGFVFSGVFLAYGVVAGFAVHESHSR